MNNLKSRVFDLRSGLDSFFITVKCDQAPLRREFLQYQARMPAASESTVDIDTIQRAPGDEPRLLPAQKTTLFLKIELGGDIR